MKNSKKNKIIVITIFIVLIGIMFFTYNKKNNINKGIISKETYAIMIEKGNGKYIEYNNTTWPKSGYKFNKSKTECINKSREIINEELVTYKPRTYTAIMKTKQSAFCTLYFDIDNVPPVGDFYIKEEKEGIKYTNNENEVVFITIEDEDIENVIEYCLTTANDSSTCEWKEVPEVLGNAGLSDEDKTKYNIEDKEFIVKDYDLGNADGEKTIYLFLKDGARNISEAKEDKITLDTTKPECTNSGDSTTWVQSRRIYWGCSDSTSGCKNGTAVGSKLFNTTTTRTFTIGEYVIEDNAGNQKACPARVANVYVDRTPPECTLTGDSTTWTRNDREIIWGCTDSHSGCNTSYSGGSKTYDYTIETDTIVAYQIRDKVGNIKNCEEQLANIYVDKEEPTVTFGIENGNKATYTCTDNGSGISEENASGSTNLTGTSDYTFDATCTDIAGNSKTDSHTYKYDSCATGNPNECMPGTVPKTKGFSGSTAEDKCRMNCSGSCHCNGSGAGKYCQCNYSEYSPCAYFGSSCQGGFKFE